MQQSSEMDPSTWSGQDYAPGTSYHSWVVAYLGEVVDNGFHSQMANSSTIVYIQAVDTYLIVLKPSDDRRRGSSIDVRIDQRSSICLPRVLLVWGLTRDQSQTMGFPPKQKHPPTQ
ncbi:uncharacterized protein A1O5_02720 [Cladophialophora psammophila CBS 110553]|uniref:Uncharacterized protein n=1 Tax=Cladophialophora psammophila CBS 110553 TaxID=1182543 RepID=W9XW00_9EURO|nr:uncharacterized protein A1O5_02720 [Cladophialophora psammophila CBS 110553]EXJ74424.1 hypothetical protein A1O5_02720 [Cladophialophora psammophila CBS 110553]